MKKVLFHHSGCYTAQKSPKKCRKTVSADTFSDHFYALFDGFPPILGPVTKFLVIISIIYDEILWYWKKNILK